MDGRSLPILTGLLLLLSVCTSAGAVTYNVNQDGLHDFTAIQPAITAAANGDTIIVAAGTYTEHINFLGKAVVLRSTDPNDPAVVATTTIDGSNQSVASVILLETGEGPGTVIDGFTITRGGYSFGAGVLCNGAGCTISNCVITANASPNRGGAIYCQNGTALYITNCSITDNSAVNMGGGIYVTNTAITITDSTFSNNAGGALYLYNGSEATISNSVFDQNICVNYGGGITCYNGRIKINAGRFTGNQSSNYGGAIYLSNSGGYLRGCTITGNRSKKGGGIYCNIGSSPELTNCVLAGNYAGDTGTPAPGGGLHCINSSNPSVRNSIFWLNRPTQVTSFAAPTIKYCLLQGGWGTAQDHNIDAEPGNPFKPGPSFLLEGSWNDNGTPTNLSDDFWDEDEIDFTDPNAYHLDEYSPCIDTGDPNSIPEPDQTDIDGNYRVLGFNVDMGIDETLDSAGQQQRVHNVTQDIWYETIQAALEEVAIVPNDELLANPGRYAENINFNGKAVTLTSRYDDNTAFVDVTVIDGQQSASAVVFDSGEDANSIIEGFTITNGGGTDGGGIYCNGSSPTIKRCTIRDNNSGNGGGIGVNNGQPTISHCVIKNNNASNNGGALALLGNSSLTVHNCAMVANTAAVSGGGIYCDAVAAGGTVKFCTIKDNTSYGLYSEGDGTGQITLENTILWNNQPEQLPEPVQIYASNPDSLTINYCDIQNGWLGDGNIDIDPNFYTWQDDSDTQVEHDYKLNVVSPCINAGDPDYVNDNEEKDIYGSNRLAYCRADIGAYEPATLSTTGLANVVNNNTQKTWYCRIQDALNAANANNEIIVSTGRYNENIIISMKITLRGTSPSDPNTIDDTIISGVITSAGDPNFPYASTVSLATGLAAGTTVKGLTITNGIGYLDEGDTPEDPNFLKGGGLFSAYNNEVSIINCNITANSAYAGGGIALQNCNDAIVAGCRVMNNSCAGPLSDAGGIFIIDCDDVTVSNSIIADNNADFSGGGISAVSSDRLTLDFCTIAKNTTAIFGSGLGLIECETATINNSIIYANTPGQIFVLDAPELSVNYCDIQNGFSGSGVNNISADPDFVDPDNGDYHISGASPCFNTGDPGYVYTSGSDFDVDSQPRLAYCRIDIGADEADDVELTYLCDLVRLKHTTTGGTTTKWYTTIQAALDDALDNDEVMVTQGRYMENVVIDHNGVLLTGTAPGDLATIINTVIDGSNPADPNAATVVTLKTDLADDAVVTGLTLTDGSGTRGSDEIFRGGGLLSIDNDRVTVSNCHIIGNTADMGGGIYLSGQYTQSDPAASCLIDSCNISGNNAAQRGGAAELYYCTDLTLSHNVITGNTQPNGTISARYISGAEINHCTIADNQAGTSGGGLKLWEAYYTVAITNSIFWDNTPDQIVNDGANPPPAVTYSDVQGSYTGTGNINLDPLFAESGTWDGNLWLPGDYHLRSEFGRWMPFVNRSDIIADGIVNMYDFVALSQQWQQSGDDLSADIDLDGTVNLADLSILAEGFLTAGAESGISAWATDDSTSPCIDAGNPADDYSLEPTPNGNRVNMGAYGATAQASRSPEAE